MSRSISIFLAPARERLHPYKSKTVKKWSYELGMYIDVMPTRYSKPFWIFETDWIKNSFADHSVAKVCCGGKCMYFDIGSENPSGNYGGDDRWFSPDDENWLDEIDPKKTRGK